MMTLRAAKFELSHNIHDVYCKVLYLDPPYNQRQYGANGKSYAKGKKVRRVKNMEQIT
ncbi:DNA adenine methylase [Campylobacter anatolicus]|uniref:DNA adenine methylase n=1 Tax=Campylobacter anatolicus TaxID=2829105 RepID=UPI00227725B2|nr:DNA adenine methylase [Campylobacter anatolicus]